MGSMTKWMSLALGSVAGGLARYFLASAVNQTMGASFPYGTLLVNMSGCLVIGVFDGMVETRSLIGPTGRLLLMSGFCGAYTTFSTLMLETSNLVRDGETMRGFINYMGSGALGFVLFRLGTLLGTVV